MVPSPGFLGLASPEQKGPNKNARLQTNILLGPLGDERLNLYSRVGMTQTKEESKTNILLSIFALLWY